MSGRTHHSNERSVRRVASRQLTLDFERKSPATLTPDEMFELADEESLKLWKEDLRVEWKPAKFSGDSLGEYFSMWANTAPRGGLIVSGILDNGVFEGCQGLPQKRVNQLEKTGHVFTPDAKWSSKRVPVKNAKGEEDFVVLFRVHYHESVVVRMTNGKAFVRRGDECHELSEEEIRELANDKGQIAFEQEPCRELKFPEDYDLDAISQWAEAARAKLQSEYEWSDTECLENRSLGRIEGKQFFPNNGCALLFAKNPGRAFPGCRVRVMRFEGEFERTGEQFNKVKDIWCEGTIPHVIKLAAEAIRSQLRTFSPLDKDGKFTLRDEYPESAWYEAIVNAVVHRSYGNGLRNVNVFVRIFDDHMTIESPGPFPPFVTPENVYKMHRPRNPKIMEAMFCLGEVQMNREGTNRMRDTMSAMGLPDPAFQQGESEQIGHALVRVTLRNNIHQRKVWIDRDVSEIIGEALAAALTTDEKRILNFIAERGAVQVNDVVRNVGIKISWQRAKKVLNDLCRKGVLQHVRFKKLKKNERDQRAYYRLSSAEPLPEGAMIANIK